MSSLQAIKKSFFSLCERRKIQILRGTTPLHTIWCCLLYTSYLRETGHEFGTVTGRPRRCGWLDAFMVKYAARINSMDSLAITRLDILDGLDEIKMCTGWEIDGKPIKYIPADLSILAKAKPVYETFKGWKCDISSVRSYEDLPQEAQMCIRDRQ